MKRSKIKRRSTVYPGALGGVIAPMSTDGETIFVPVVNSPLEVVSGSEKQEPGPSTGEVVALDVGDRQGQVEPGTRHAGLRRNDRRSTTSSSPPPTKARSSAFDNKSGQIVWRETLPAGTNAGVMVAGDTLIAPAGVAAAEGQTPQIVAYRLE